MNSRPTVKTQIPDSLKADLPQTTWGKMLSATPVVMTVIATMLAGLSSSEMTRAQYDRSLAAQQQSKAGDQWSYFQAKKLRSALQHNTIDLLQSTTELPPFDSSKLPASTSQPARDALQKGKPPALPAAAPLDPKLKAALDAVETQKPEEEISQLLTSVPYAMLANALSEARQRSLDLDATTTPINEAIDKTEKSLAGYSQPDIRNFTAARLRYTSARYDAEAKLNQAIANLLELQVRKNNYSAEHHHRRSQKFFYGMLAAQLGVIMSTLAMAARARNFLWSIAAAAGLIAVVFAIYVYLRV
jgi:hypothetical protein